ncbi:MAG: Rossman fold protein, TIGR00730 family [Candidatus Rokubacteria bacterium 13_1_40CM_69_27]|nr:MAG: Rossman fold protein, TIGR00730 family [Candidatus Rokubacteria bacterium 13_1_40CM_69_27]OLC39730.1 MAG: Rossman fold protein, TIGR00730 family [Candidatus Rokubacteria bacterium 13_1_40CM_4_69_5]OLE38611.1 MAG: Rossman fold protein, TIGR00730 family [Candidatus Rokubacteria bacterium 13_1_20CM_2_70_7]
MKRICVFAGSSTGARPEYAEAARELAAELVRRQLGLVYGGGSVGLMGVLADAALTHGGEVIGVIPRGLATRELAHTGLTEMRVVGSMHERKALMASLVDGFIALPGGLGTFEETLEVLTWSQLGIHRKPVGVLNVAGYFDGLLRMLVHAMREGFVRREYLALLLFGDTPAALLDAVAAWQPLRGGGAWLDQSQT